MRRIAELLVLKSFTKVKNRKCGPCRCQFATPKAQMVQTTQLLHVNIKRNCLGQLFSYADVASFATKSMSLVTAYHRRSQGFVLGTEGTPETRRAEIRGRRPRAGSSCGRAVPSPPARGLRIGEAL